MTAQQQGVLSAGEVEAFARETGAPIVRGKCTARALVQRIAARAAEVERERCAKIAEAYMHIGPFGDSQLDRIAAYSNRTCELISAAIRATPEAPDAE